ncbi:anti-sigma factor [Cellulomonas sp. URHE0023]|uniref:anti-sigma factor n=1 Tax=Cellulomonas sp. URHE0023 TaxID=1380354 RepID=UPI0004820015|nr:anti-sigma factor [Cellulomonas sp. URHE0023]
MSFDDSHVDDDVLALLALGEDAGSTADHAHLEQCRRCADEVQSLRDVVLLARSGTGGARLVAPAPAVWDRVADELRLAPGTRALGASTPQPPPPAEPLADVVPLRPRRSRPVGWSWVAGAAAVGLVVGGGGAWWLANRGQSTTVLATATLEPLPGWDAAGSAVVETSPDGGRVLVVDLSTSVPSGNAFQEVWLLKPDVSGLVSLGTLEGASGRFDVPDGLDLTQYSVVDVSQENLDGDPAHSGDSIVRGPLQA